MRIYGRACADVVSAGAGGIVGERSIEAAAPPDGGGDFAAPVPHRLLCRVDSFADLTHDTRELSLAIESGGPLRFRAGQYVEIEFAPGLSRPYSMASTPADELLVFYLRRTPGGKTSSYVADQFKPGDKVRVTGPLGSAFLRDAHAGPVLLLAGGSGLAPMLSILRTLLARDPGANVALYFGARAERDVYHEPLLAQMAARHANFSYQIVLSEPGVGSGRRRGLLHQALVQDVADASGYSAYLAGPPAMVAAAAKLLRERGAAREDIHADALHAKARRQ